MARQKGHIKYTGTLGDVRHFKIKGQNGFFAGLVGGPTDAQVKTAPEFKRTRENMNEFGGCAKAGKSVRIALSEVLNGMTDPQSAGRLTSIMKKINLEDGTEARGVRKVEISTQRTYLYNFAFDKNTSFSSIVYIPYSATHSADRVTGTLATVASNPLNSLKAPAGATHFRFINAIGVISDFIYNDVTKTYEPSNPALNEMSNTTYGSYNDLGAAYAGETLDVALPTGTVVSGDVSVLQCIGIEFFQKVNGNYYKFSTGN
ncbi:MAG TPA: hypothetical protein PKO18_09550, partial [Chitinophagales bacterium]|nr:hypothetical protein [Chitinophagales bacterium]